MEETKECSRCHQHLPLEAFYLLTHRSDRLGWAKRRHAYCKTCHRQYLQQRHEHLMDQLLASDVEQDDPEAVPKTLGFPVLPVQKLPPRDAAYFAGIVDGEGSITVQVGGGQLTAYVLVSNSSAALMDWLYESAGGYVRAAISGRSAVIKGTKPMYRWQIGGANAITLLEQVAPHLVIKGRQAHAALAAISAWHTRDLAGALAHTQVVRRLNNFRARKYWKAKREEAPPSHTTG